MEKQARLTGLPVPQFKNAMNHRQAQKLWIEAGGTIEPVRRTGEIRYRHPFLSKPQTANARRADTPAIVVRLLEKLARIIMEGQ